MDIKENTLVTSEHSVTFDILGNRDTLLFTIININGVDYLQAYSVKK